jgi:hypothetical protein
VNDLPWINKWSNSHPLVFTWCHPIEPINLLSFVTAEPKKKGKGKELAKVDPQVISEFRMEVD